MIFPEDLLDGVAPYESQYTIGELTRNFGHFSPLGSTIVARYTVDRLSATGLLDPSRVKRGRGARAGAVG